MLNTSKKKLLLIGGGYADVPLIKSAQKLGYYVITSGNKEDDIGHQFSDKYFKGDFSNKEDMLDIAIKLKVDAICPCANDFSAITCSYISEKLNIGNFDNYETSKIIHHKDKYRKFAQENNILTPIAKSFINEEEAINFIKEVTFPIIIKPIDLSGGKGVSKIDGSNVENIQELIHKAFTSSKAKKIVIEEFIEGTNHGLSTFIKNGKIVFYFSDNEHYYINKYLVSGASTPSIVPKYVINKLIKESEKIASILKLKDGIFHIQFILKEKQPYIIEICRRPPGDLYIDFVKYATGIDYSEWIIKYFCRANIDDISFKNHTKGYFTRHCIMTDKNGIISNIIIHDDLKENIVNKTVWWNKGDKIEDFMTYKAGIIFLKYSSLKEMEEKVNNINNLITIETK